ncbi:carotenoid oxygenase family protein [Streptomyces yerevanensis]|uniref:carotenoid oxygenase family protein n=1 Tax=Streptomyces yerevanensis TaxID=66378 RepID=UPI00068E02FF|nr:carotenoid oxygenase family protein [Streptomyces yerevanensis]
MTAPSTPSPSRTGMRFPDRPIYSGWDTPSRVEADVFEIEAEGEIPRDLRGRYYQIAPDPAFPNRTGDDIPFNGDGMLRMFTFADGHVDYRSRYVQTEKLKLERAARRSLYGAYRNPYTDHFTVAGKGRGAANTSVVFHAGKLLVLKEDARATRVDTDSLETYGEWDFDGAVTSPTFTAHPRIDPVTGEMFAFGYEAKGLASRDIAYYVMDAHGKVLHEVWFKAPYTSMIHDFVVTQDYAIFPVMPTTTDLDRLKAGGPHWQWDPSRETCLGVMPRHGTADQIRWYRGPARWAYHFFNAHNEGTTIHIDGCVSQAQAAPFLYPDPLAYDITKGVPRITRWTADYAADESNGFEEQVLQPEFTEFPLVDDRVETGRQRIGFAGARVLGDEHKGDNGIALLNSILRYDFDKQQATGQYVLPEHFTFQEPVFVPRDDDAPEGDGYLLVLANNWTTMLNDLLILDTAELAAGPVATLHLPLRLRSGIHGTWVPEHLVQAG